MAKPKINERQKRAVDYFIELGNKTQALVKAGYKSKNTASVFNQPAVKQYLNERLTQLDDERIATAGEVMKYLTSVMRGEEKEQVVVVEGVGDGVSSARHVDKIIAVKDRIKAAELLGKRYGIYTEQIKHSGAVPVVIKDDVNE